MGGEGGKGVKKRKKKIEKKRKKKPSGAKRIGRRNKGNQKRVFVFTPGFLRQGDGKHL